MLPETHCIAFNCMVIYHIKHSSKLNLLIHLINWTFSTSSHISLPSVPSSPKEKMIDSFIIGSWYRIIPSPFQCQYTVFPSVKKTPINKQRSNRRMKDIFNRNHKLRAVMFAETTTFQILTLASTPVMRWTNPWHPSVLQLWLRLTFSLQLLYQWV